MTLRWRVILRGVVAVLVMATALLLWKAREAPASWPRPAVAPPELALAQGQVPGRPLWARVNDELWQVDPSGRLLSRTPWQALGLPAAPASVQIDAEGRLRAWVAGHPTLWVFDTPSLKPAGTLTLQWPEPAREGLATARHMAVHADGRVAVCHGGRGQVLVFQPDGRLWAITADGATRACGALWWEDDDLWVAQVHDQALVHLRSDTLDPIGHVKARPAWPAGSTIVSVSRHPRHGIDVHAPLATLLVRAPQAPSVHLLYLWQDGMTIEQALARDSQPQDAAWRGEELLVADAQALDWLRFDIDRQALPGFAEEGTVAQLRRQFRPPSPSGPPPRQQLLDHAITTATGAVALMLVLVFTAPAPVTASGSSPNPVLPRPRQPQGTWQERWFQRAGHPHLQRVLAQEQFEAQGEQLREAFCLRHADGVWWLLLSNRRLLQYRLQGRQAVPVRQISRADLARVRLTLPSRGRPWQACHLRIELRDGQHIAGRLRPATLARRVATMLQLRTTPSAGPTASPTPRPQGDPL